MDAVTRTLRIIEDRRKEEERKVTRHMDRCYPPGRPVKVRKGQRWIRATIAERPQGLTFPELAVTGGTGKVSHYHFQDVQIDRTQLHQAGQTNGGSNG